MTSSQAPYTFSPGTSPPNDFPSATLSTSPPNNPKIVLRPSLMTNSIHHLSTLSHSNHTLSPYTRSLAHFTVRSVPPRPLTTSLSSERQPVKAKRKRTYRLGGQQPLAKDESHVTPDDPSLLTTDHDVDVPTTRPSSPPPPSEFDASDMDLYFRSHDDTTTTTTTPSSSRQTPSSSSAVHRLRQRHPSSSVLTSPRTPRI